MTWREVGLRTHRLINADRHHKSMNEKHYLLPALRGGISVVEREGKIASVSLENSRPAKVAGAGRLAADLRDYFSGMPVDFKDYDVDYSGCTSFQKKVLEATRSIPYGETRTYGEVARMAGSPRAARAVGQVMAGNRTCIFVPCHRVVAHNGLGGFTGGIDWKIRLLELERPRRRS